MWPYKNVGVAIFCCYLLEISQFLNICNLNLICVFLFVLSIHPLSCWISPTTNYECTIAALDYLHCFSSETNNHMSPLLVIFCCKADKQNNKPSTLFGKKLYSRFELPPSETRCFLFVISSWVKIFITNTCQYSSCAFGSSLYLNRESECIIL